MLRHGQVFLLLIVLWVESHATAQDCRNITVHDSLTLQGTLNSLLDPSGLAAGTNCSTIVIPVGEHVLSTQMVFPAELGSLELVGSPDQGVSSVTCSYSTVEQNYTWYFSRLNSLKIQHIHFNNCPRPLRIDTVSEVEITNSSFRYFTEAVLDVYNCHHVMLTNVTLQHNRGSGISAISYRGNTGGISFGYNNLPPHFNTPSVYVSDSVFSNNTAAADSMFLTSSQAFARRVFTGRGGALAVFCNESHAGLNVTLVDSIFEHNSARSFGGAVYILPGGGAATHHNVLVQRCSFDLNEAGICGGGVQVTYPTTGPKYNPHLITIIDCNVTNNMASFNGGGMYISSITHGDGNSVDIQDSLFIGNSARYGGALVLKSIALFLDQSSLPYHHVSNCTFLGNTGLSGVVSTWFVSASFSGINCLNNNRGNALQVISSVVHLSGEIHFVNNSGSEDSAMHLLSFSQAVLSPGLYINFEGNTGRFGAGMYVDDQYDSSIVYSRASACFLRHETDNAPNDWEDIRVQFSDNRAVLASNLYLSRLDWHVCSSPFLYTSHFMRNGYDILDWPIWEFGDSNVNTGYADPTIPQMAMQTTVKRLTTPNVTVKAWPGFKYTFEMGGIDEYNSPTTTLARLLFRPYNGTKVRFHPEVIVVGPDPTSGLLTKQFTVFHEIVSDSSGATEGPLGEVVLQTLDTTAIGVESASFVLEGQLCPGGYVLGTSDSSQSVCLCNEDISEVLLCKDDQETVVIKQGKWAVFIPSKEAANLQFYTCPTGYCRCRYDTVISNDSCVYSYSHTDPDLQCVCDRKGTLCGECWNEGDGVSALLNDCVSCSNASVLLILALGGCLPSVVTDVVLFAVLTIISIPLPSWTYPFIFYIQLAPIVGLYFPQSFVHVGKYLYFIGSASGFYFVYDFCLYESMSSQVAYLLRFLPLLLAIVTCTPILLYRSTRFRIKRKPLSSHGVWWIILLLYTHVVHTALSVLNCPIIADTHGAFSPRWFVDGEVKCFTGSHSALAVLSVLILLAAGALIPLCILLSVGNVEKFPKSVRQFHQSLTQAYGVKCKWWSAVELARRLVFLLLVVELPDNKAIPVLLLAVSTTVYVYVQPYKSRVTNMIEAAVNVNFLLLLILNATSFFHDDYLTFPTAMPPANVTGCSDGVSGIATVSWILMPFYYLPLVALCVAFIVSAVVCIRKKSGICARRSADLQDNAEPLVSDGGSKVEYMKWDVELSTDGFLHLETLDVPQNETLKKSSND